MEFRLNGQIMKRQCFTENGWKVGKTLKIINYIKKKDSHFLIDLLTRI